MATASTSIETYRFSKKTHRLQFNLFESKKETHINVPVTSRIHDVNELHRWRIVYDTSEVQHIEGEDKVTCIFRISGKHVGSFKYDKAHFEVKVLNTSGVVLCVKKADLAEPNFKQFNFKKKALNTDYSEIVFVEVTFESYPIEPEISIEPVQAWVDKGYPIDAAFKTKYQRFLCHKSWLSSKSEYLKSLIVIAPKKKVEINWVDVASEDTVDDLLFYVYTGLTPRNLATTWAQLMKVSRVCLMDELSLMCHSYLESTITVDNMMDLLKMALHYRSEELQDYVINYIVDNYDSSSGATPPWQALEPEMAMKLADRVLTVMVMKKLHI